MALASFLLGLGLSLSLVASIGAQNTFVLRQAMRKNHVWMVVALCVASDVVMIGGGVGGASALITSMPTALVVIRWLGAAFLFWCGIQAVRRIRAGGQLLAGEGAPISRQTAVLSTLGFTWLNPSAWLDSVVMLGSVGAGQPVGGRLAFVVGALVASVGWFCGVGVLGSKLAPLLAKPWAWRGFEGLVALMMFGECLGLISL